MNRTNSQKGFTMIELVMYVAGLLVIGSVLIVLIVQFFNVYKELIAIPKADRTGLLLVDRITKEIRGGNQIDTVNSQFNTPNGVIEFDVLDDESSTDKRFYVQDGRVMYREGAGAAEAITPRGLFVSNFNFIMTSTGVSEGVKFSLELQFQTRDGIETKSYTGFGILRESYE